MPREHHFCRRWTWECQGEGAGDGEEASESDALLTSARGEGGGKDRQFATGSAAQGARKPVGAEMPSSWGRAMPCHPLGVAQDMWPGHGHEGRSEGGRLEATVSSVPVFHRHLVEGSPPHLRVCLGGASHRSCELPLLRGRLEEGAPCDQEPWPWRGSSVSRPLRHCLSSPPRRRAGPSAVSEAAFVSWVAKHQNRVTRENRNPLGLWRPKVQYQHGGWSVSTLPLTACVFFFYRHSWYLMCDSRSSKKQISEQNQACMVAS